MDGSELWFTEYSDGRTVSLGLRFKSILHQEKSEFQMLEIFDTVEFGRMMALDGLVMLTEHDEFVYHEMISHVPMAVHGSPRRVLVIGGGDGGTVTELVKYPGIEQITLCEIDGAVVQSAKTYFPRVAAGLGDPRVKVLIADGIEFVKSTPAGSYDLVLIDSSDPVGPGIGLFNRDFYQQVARILAKGGVMCAQTESPWLDAKMLRSIQENLRANFNFVSPYVAPIPTYPRGFWSWTVAAQERIRPSSLDFSAGLRSADLQYLTPALLQTSFTLPNFFKKKIGLEQA